ncbi:hypothetical protein [Corynebacterium variabile]|uniref:hypothetical protein n=1 Tax=Corynebacterium variabile TaxID=1727 RepID=UPI003A950C78
MSTHQTIDDMHYADPCDYATQTPAAAPNGAEPTPSPVEQFNPPTGRMEPQKTHAVTPVEATNTTPVHSRTSQTHTGPHIDALAATRRATTPDDLPDGPEKVVFTHSPATRAVWQAARARMGSPWAVLGVVMAATVAATGPHVQLPALVGGPGSLNMLVGLVGEPGGGKGTAEGIAHHLFTVADEKGNPVEVPELPLGSGEGIAELFTRRDQPGDDSPATATPDRVMFRVPEIDALTAASSKRESTILPVLRQAFMGEPLGHTGASQATTRNVPAHTYRLTVVMGIQPRRSGGLLNDADGGTPQRVQWLPVAYAGAPDTTPTAPAPFVIRLPEGTRTAYGNTPVTITLPDTVARLVRANRLRRLRGEAGEGLDGHLLLTREKTAAALALMDGRTNVTKDDWAAAGAVIDLSAATRKVCQDARKGADQDEDRRAGERAETRRDASERKRMDTVRDRTLERLRATDGPVLFRTLSRPLNSNQRRLLPDVLDELMEGGLVTRHDTYNGNGEPTAEFQAAPV